MNAFSDSQEGVEQGLANYKHAEEEWPVTICSRGEWCVDAKGLSHPRAEYSLTIDDLRDSAWLPRLLNLGFSCSEDLIPMWYAAHHIHDRGSRDRSVRMEIRLRLPMKSERQIPGTQIYLDVIRTTTSAAFAIADAEAIRTHNPELIEADLGVDDDEIARSDERRRLFARLLATCSDEELDPRRDELACLWSELAGVGAIDGDQLIAIERYLRRYSPVAVSEAMKLAREKHWRLGADAFSRIGNWLRIVLEQVEEPQADRIYYLAKVVNNMFGMASEREAIKFLRAAAYFHVPLDMLEKETLNCRAYQAWTDLVRKEIRERTD